MPDHLPERPRIAVVRPDRVGDVVISSSILAALHERWPGANLAWGVRPAMATLFRNHPRIQELILLPEAAEGSWWERVKKLKQELAAFRADAIVFLHPDPVAQAAAWSAKIPRRLGYQKRWWNWTLTESLPYCKSEGKKHEADYNLDLLKKWDGTSGAGLALKGDITLSPDSETTLSAKMPWNPGTKSYFVLNPSAFSPVARWPVSHFVTLAEALLREEEVCLVLTGDSEEDPSATEIGAALKKYGDRVVNLAGRTSLAELGALLRQSCGLVTRDTGPSHIAAAVGCPVVVIFGRTDPIYGPRRWRPLGDLVEVAEHGLTRAPGEERNDFWKRCYLSITPEEVLKKLHRIRIFK